MINVSRIYLIIGEHIEEGNSLIERVKYIKVELVFREIVTVRVTLVWTLI